MVIGFTLAQSPYTCSLHTAWPMNRERNVLVLKAAQQKARFEVLTATSMKMAVFRDVAPCSVVHVDRL
jgi:hypothetical protein